MSTDWPKDPNNPRARADGAMTGRSTQDLREQLNDEKAIVAALRKWVGEDAWIDFVDANHDLIFKD